jgi:hypothetical protein
MASSKAIQRYLCSESVRVCRLDGPPKPVLLMPANLEEISRSSAELIAESPLPQKAKVRIFSKQHSLEGRVESCVWDRLLGYIVKVRFAPKSRWSEQWFMPEHLLALPSEASALEVA